LGKRVTEQVGPEDFVDRSRNSNIPGHGHTLWGEHLVLGEVTQILNLRFRRFVTGGVCVEGCGTRGLAAEGGADFKSAIRQVANLRYGSWLVNNLSAGCG